MNPANMNFKDAEIVILVDGQEIPIEGFSSAELDSETFDFDFEEQPLSIPYQGTMTVSDYRMTLSLKHLNKFKVVRMNGRTI